MLSESYCKILEFLIMINSLLFHSLSILAMKTAASGEGIVALYAAPNPYLLNKICLNQNSGI